MSARLRAFMLGFTNAFTPIDYSELNKIGEISKRIDRKMISHRRLTREQVNEITTKSSQSKSIRASSY